MNSLLQTFPSPSKHQARSSCVPSSAPEDGLAALHIPCTWSRPMWSLRWQPVWSVWSCSRLRTFVGTDGPASCLFPPLSRRDIRGRVCPWTHVGTPQEWGRFNGPHSPIMGPLGWAVPLPGPALCLRSFLSAARPALSGAVRRRACLRGAVGLLSAGSDLGEGSVGHRSSGRVSVLLCTWWAG